MCEYPSGSVTGFTLFPLAVHTAMFFSFSLLFQKEMGCCAIAVLRFSFHFRFCPAKWFVPNFHYNTERHGEKLHCVVYLALVVGFPTWNVTAGSGDEGGLLGGLKWCQVPSKL